MTLTKDKLAFSPQEVADLTGLCLNTVYNLIREGRIGHIRTSKTTKILVSRANLDRFLDGETQKRQSFLDRIHRP